MAANFTDFGKMKAERIAKLLFGVGTALSAVSSLMFGKYLYLSNMYNEGYTYMENGQQWFTERPVNNLPLGIAGGIASFILSVIVWKVACEVLFLVIRCMETYLEGRSGGIDKASGDN